MAAQDNVGHDTLKVMDYENPKEYVIADVTVSGIEFIQKEVLVSLSGLKEGNTITLPGDEVTDVLKKFWSQGLFSDASITAIKDRDDSIWLDIYLTEQSRMSRLEHHRDRKIGNPGYKGEDQLEEWSTGDRRYHGQYHSGLSGITLWRRAFSIAKPPLFLTTIPCG